MTCSLAVTSLLQIVVIWINFGRERINKNNYFREKNLKSSNSELVWRLPWLSGINLMCTALWFNICIYYSDRHLKPSYSPSSASFRLDPPSIYNLMVAPAPAIMSTYQACRGQKCLLPVEWHSIDSFLLCSRQYLISRTGLIFLPEKLRNRSFSWVYCCSERIQSRKDE